MHVRHIDLRHSLVHVVKASSAKMLSHARITDFLCMLSSGVRALFRYLRERLTSRPQPIGSIIDSKSGRART